MSHAAAVLRAARAAPPTDLTALVGNAPILVLTPHPDDESLGCGGLIAACSAAGIRVDVALLTDGTGSHPLSHTHPAARRQAVRLAELVAALAILGVPAARLHPLGWPDAAAPAAGPGFDAAVAQVAALLRACGAATLFASWGDDPHCDHAAAARIAAAAAGQAGIRHLAYPVWGWTLPPGQPVQAGPPLRLDVTRFLPQKRRAIACHRSQFGRVIRDSPGAFRLPRQLLDQCLTGSEVFFDQTAAARRARAA